MMQDDHNIIWQHFCSTWMEHLSIACTSTYSPGMKLNVKVRSHLTSQNAKERVTHAQETLVVTRRLPWEVEVRIARDYIAKFNLEDHLHSSEELIEISDGAYALLIIQQDVMDAQVLARLPHSVLVIATLSAGFDHIDLAAATERGISCPDTCGFLLG